MRTNINLLFYLKKRSTYKNDPVAIYLRFTVDGQRAEASTGKTCEPSRWNVQVGRAIGTKEDIRTLNAYLDTLQVMLVSGFEAPNPTLYLNNRNIIAAMGDAASKNCFGYCFKHGLHLLGSWPITANYLKL
ncbi:Arm DNA-binding domain-containing protein [Mucilaginibacter ximonensis]|uniref:Arm DNA-binding domain-containing protein n=1 Tax=Mucilaginibacter ximonensis TaxID=538021 RepID=A0ABW5YC99_9SPHI